MRQRRAPVAALFSTLACLCVIAVALLLAKAAADTLYLESTTVALRRAAHGWHVLRTWSGILLALSIVISALRDSIWMAGVAAYGLIGLLCGFAAPDDSTPTAIALVLGAFTSAVVALVTCVGAATAPR